MTIDSSLGHYLTSLSVWPDIRNNVTKARACPWSGDKAGDRAAAPGEHRVGAAGRGAVRCLWLLATLRSVPRRAGSVRPSLLCACGRGCSWVWPGGPVSAARLRAAAAPRGAAAAACAGRSGPRLWWQWWRGPLSPPWGSPLEGRRVPGSARWWAGKDGDAAGCRRTGPQSRFAAAEPRSRSAVLPGSWLGAAQRSQPPSAAGAPSARPCPNKYFSLSRCYF